MIHTSYRLVKTLVIISLTYFLSGCAGDLHTVTYPDNSQIETAETGNDQLDPSLEKSEAEMCLDQELQELDQTGIWNETFPPISIDPEQRKLYDFPIVLNKQVQMYLHLFQNSQRDLFAGWLARSTTYMPIMEAELAANGLPHDLVYLPMIESGYNPLACSRSMAVGLWQFMQATGTQYDLEINKFVDERRDVEKSTKAAVAFLADLYKEFGDWHLAVAAYNGGPGKIRNGLNKYNVDNFWDLASKENYLALETKRYVPKLIAALIIAKQPERFGFTNINYHPVPRFDKVRVGPGMSFDAIGLISESSPTAIKKLNHELRLDKTPPNVASYTVKIPETKAAIAKKNLSRLHTIVNTGFKSHKIGKGDTLAKICEQYGINRTTLLKVNNLRSPKLAYGQNLRIPYNTVSYQLLPEGSVASRTDNRQNLVMHQVKPGETISKIATQYNVPINMIASWNNLNGAYSIRTGQQLTLFIDQKKSPSMKETKSLAIVENDNKTLLKAERRKVHVTEMAPSNSAPYKLYSVRDGDTLWTISQKFSASTADIKKWNNLKDNLIHPGIVLKLKKV
ncbi:MAG TPA: lytic transglycosylase [Desulfobulbaceae bacterium]|nr:lytic transglycosylase [Desulfobulbaceae bacterium]